MRPIAILVLLLASSAPAAGQGLLLPVRCQGECASGALSIDSVKVWAHLARGEAVTWVDHVVRNGTGAAIDGAFFFPLPAGATVTRVTIYDGSELEVYNEWSGPQESRWILEGLARERRDARLREYAGANVVHVRIPAIGAHGTKQVQIAYTQPLRAEAGVIGYRYPISVGAPVPAGRAFTLGLEIRTEAGFVDVHSPSHGVDVQLGMEPGPCQPRERCGTRGYPSARVRVIRLRDATGARARDFELLYTPAVGPPGAPGAALVP